VIPTIFQVPFSQCFSLLPECSARFSLERSRCQAFFTNAAAVFVHGEVRTLATAAQANGHLVFSVMRRRQNLNVGIEKRFGHSNIHPNAPKSKLATRNRTAFSANKMISNELEKFPSGVLNDKISKTKSVNADGPTRGSADRGCGFPLPSMLLYGGYGYEN
jgi:hypothetical protein